LSGCIGARRDFYREHIFEFLEFLHDVINCVRSIFLSCIQIILDNGDFHPIKTNALFKKPYLSNVSLVAF
jgi:hypothetical protein